jgi:UDP-N-acetyl-alpha-D-muramoyl-L-alanyl-L-glutamate epimerase
LSDFSRFSVDGSGDGLFDPKGWPVFHYVSRSLTWVNGTYLAELHYALGAEGSAEAVVGPFDQPGHDTIRFVERYVFPAPNVAKHADEQRARVAVAERLLTHLWLVAGLSYYKMSAAPIIRLASGYLDSEGFVEADLDLHRLLLMRGLGEFCFVNDLDPELRPTYLLDGPLPLEGSLPFRLVLDQGPLVPVGGGKDSCVTIEGLRRANLNPTLVTVRRFPIIQDVIDDGGLCDLAVERILDPGIAAINQAGALNGHVPATAIVSFAALIAAVLNGHDAVVMSNERSASEGNVEYLGVSINHQWAKSDEAEAAIAAAVARITPDLLWFSLLRPFSELDISRRFALTCSRYLGSFSSCNRTQRIDPDRRVSRWCGECPKCQFVYLALATALPRAQVEGIWGAELFATSPIEGFRSLLGLTEWKPFECVGEHVECRVALAIIIRQRDWADHPALYMLADEVRSVEGWPTEADHLACFSVGSAEFVPPSYAHVMGEFGQYAAQ